MTEYVWRNATYESVIKEPVIKPILLVIKSLNKERFTKKEVYIEGKRKRILGFPNSPDTILRALNSMSLPGVEILQKESGCRGLPHHWRLIKNPFPYEELIVYDDINILKNISKDYLLKQKQTEGYSSIIADDSITVYGFPRPNFNEFEKDFNRIKNEMLLAMDELTELTLKSRQRLFDEKIEKLFNKPVPLLDKQLGIIFIYCFAVARDPEFKQIQEWFNLENNSISIKSDLYLAKVLMNKFYPSKKEDEILRMLKTHNFEKGFLEELMLLFRFFVKDLTAVAHLLAVLHGGLLDRMPSRTSSSMTSSFFTRNCLIDEEQLKTYNELSEKHRDRIEKMIIKRKENDKDVPLDIYDWLDNYVQDVDKVLKMNKK